MTLSKDLGFFFIILVQRVHLQGGGFTHVAGTPVRSGRESEGNWEGRPSVHCSGRPFHHREDHHTVLALGCRRAGIRWGEAEDEHHHRRRVAGREMGRRD